jgi:threonyl-tRNA synthetase
MLHRTVFGSLERFIGILIEHYGGNFPLWLSPVQVVLVTVTNRADELANFFAKELKKRNLRVEIDLRNEKLGYKIREARLNKLPFILVFGDKEVQEGTASVRRLGGEELGTMTVEDFGQLAAKEAAIPSWD